MVDAVIVKACYSPFNSIQSLSRLHPGIFPDCIHTSSRHHPNLVHGHHQAWLFTQAQDALTVEALKDHTAALAATFLAAATRHAQRDACTVLLDAAVAETNRRLDESDGESGHPESSLAMQFAWQW